MKILLGLVFLSGLAFAENWNLRTSKDADPILKAEKDHEKLDHELVLSASTGSLHIGRITAFTLSGGYHLFMKPEFQVGLDASVELASGTSAFSFLAGATLSIPFDRDFRDAFFFYGGLGFGTRSSTVTTNEFLFAVRAGKRFHVYQNLIYRPSLGLVRDMTYGTGFEIRFFSASLVF